MILRCMLKQRPVCIPVDPGALLLPKHRPHTVEAPLLHMVSQTPTAIRAPLHPVHLQPVYGLLLSMLRLQSPDLTPVEERPT
jgi:hypothetical protein